MKNWENADIIELNIKATEQDNTTEIKCDLLYYADDGVTVTGGKQGVTTDASGNVSWLTYYP